MFSKKFVKKILCNMSWENVLNHAQTFYDWKIIWKDHNNAYQQNESWPFRWIKKSCNDEISNIPELAVSFCLSISTHLLFDI